ncbi:MAG: hypothetical protein JW984_06035 [Deltaproteobacteria bacterium]|uniref:Uncharacterized protein n=1 Tax=Candidatus Zymogenus saltonus TaxID=2844893 RepID=A0A9D8KEL7_9DELT|nr:hypothetical protein [Candidatus Zymogenus saltonus]
MADEGMLLVRSVAELYFKDLADTLPTISASDEFYFFPHLPLNGSDPVRLMESLDPDEIGEFVSRLRGYLGRLS